MNSIALKSADIDNLGRRLPCMLLTSLVIWVILLWGFGLLLKNMAEEAEKPLTAEVIEVHPEKHLAVPPPPKPKPVRKTTPPQLPAPAQKPIVQAPEVPALPPIPTNMPHVEQSVPYNVPSGVTSNGPFVPGAKSTQGSGESITPPQFGAAYLNNPKPAYPAFARRMGIQGTVMLKVLVSKDGFTLKVQVAQSSGSDILDNTAAETVKTWRFVPARRGDTPIDEWVQVPIAFHLTR